MSKPEPTVWFCDREKIFFCHFLEASIPKDSYLGLVHRNKDKMHIDSININNVQTIVLKNVSKISLELFVDIIEKRYIPNTYFKSDEYTTVQNELQMLLPTLDLEEKKIFSFPELYRCYYNAWGSDEQKYKFIFVPNQQVLILINKRQYLSTWAYSDKVTDVNSLFEIIIDNKWTIKVTNSSTIQFKDSLDMFDLLDKEKFDQLMSGKD